MRPQGLVPNFRRRYRAMSECTALSTVGFVQLTRGFAAIVDSNDLPIVVGIKWSAERRMNTTYARNERHGLMHRFLMGMSSRDRVDHINGFGFDNRRKNLRVATHQENMRNRRKRSLMTSKFKGVHYDSSRRCRCKWRASMSVNKRTVHLGRFATEDDAARAYDKAAIELYGEFARLNFPHEQRQGA